MVLQLAKRTRCGYWAHLASGFDNKLVSPVSLWTLFVELHRLKWARAQAVRRISDQLTTKELDEQSVSVLDQKKRTDMSVKDQGVVGCVFWLERHCPSWICTTWSDGKQTVVPGSFSAFEGCCAQEEAWIVGKPDLDVAPWHCDSSRIAPHLHLSGKTSDICCAASNPILRT